MPEFQAANRRRIEQAIAKTCRAENEDQPRLAGQRPGTRGKYPRQYSKGEQRRSLDELIPHRELAWCWIGPNLGVCSRSDGLWPSNNGPVLPTPKTAGGHRSLACPLDLADFPSCRGYLRALRVHRWPTRSQLDSLKWMAVAVVIRRISR